MKKFKIIQKIKKRLTSVLMFAVLAVSLIGIIPKENVYATSFYSLETTRLDDDGNPLYDGNFLEHSAYQFQCIGVDATMIVVYSPYKYGTRFLYIFLSSDDNFNGVKVNCVDDNGDTSNYTLAEGGMVSTGTKNYQFYYSDFNGGHYDFKYHAMTKITTDEEMQSHGTQYEQAKYYVENYVNFGDEWTDIENGSSDADNLPDGSLENPTRDKSVGYPDIYDYKFLISSPSSGGESDKLYNSDYVKWKSKSTTGFKLVKPDSEYKNVYIQAKIVSRYQYNDSMWGNGDWHNYDNYGEEGWFNLIDASEKELTVSFQQLTELLSKTHSEQHYFKKTNIDYDYYFRIVYTRADDLKVIPTYYSGGWRRVSCHSNNGKHDEDGEGENSSAIIEDGDDDSGKWKTDEDSPDNGKNIDNGTASGSDIEDAKDNANNKDKDSSGGDVSINIKSFMNQVGNVPKAIAKLFAFLPDWVTAFISFGFIVLVALMIIKAIRG